MERRDKGPTTKGPAEWFTGDVWVDTLAQGHGATPTTVGLVHFTPGARTAWHAHGVAQTLYVTEGQGRAQSRGEPVVTMRAGDVVFTPGGEWHWHGAAPGHFMAHLAVSEGGAEWGEQVSDADYIGETK
ncbi:MAG TPA: cupin domain-containing protein [Acidimicrobiales bacterium]|nr:cupin domain-containing protein [Acidimicrobiales bacterium]